MRTYIAEPDRGPRNWNDKAARRKRRSTATGDGFKGIAARVCSGNGENGSSETSRTSLTLVDWTGYTYEAKETYTRNF